MSLTEGLLIVIIVVLTFVLITKRRDTTTTTRSWDCVSRDTGDVATVKVKYTTPEEKFHDETAEYFDCKNVDKKMFDCECGDGTFEYATNDFGVPGADYKDWVLAAAVDPQAIKNHDEYVRDRKKNKDQIVTGPTVSFGEIEGNDAIPWWGIRGRPRAIPKCAETCTTQVPDVNPNSYVTKSKFVWDSS